MTYSKYLLGTNTNEINIEDLTHDGNLIVYAYKPTEEMKLAAVRNLGATIKYIHNPSEELQLIAVKKK